MSLHDSDPGRNGASTIANTTSATVLGDTATELPANDRSDWNIAQNHPNETSEVAGEPVASGTPDRPRLSTFGGVRDDTIGRDDLLMMVAYMLRCSDVASVATDVLPDGELLGVRVSEELFGVVWDAYRTIRSRIRSQPQMELVRVEAMRVVDQKYRDAGLEAARSEVNEICDYVQGLREPMFDNSSTGLGLLRHFLTERFLREELRLVGIGQGEINWDALQQTHERIRRLDHAAGGVSRSLADRWGDYEAGLARYRGRAMLGIATGWPQFDRLTLGLRGVVLLTSRPGAGKSSFFGHAMIGAVRHTPNVCGVYVSLGMDRETIEQRIHAHLSELPLPTVLRGSPELEGRGGRPAPAPYFTPADQAKMYRAGELIRELGPRLLILGREDLGPKVSVEAIRTRVDGFKRSCGAESAVVVLDYLSLLDVPMEVDRSELEADKWRITQARRIVEGTQTVAFPEGDALLVICESRKPGNSRDGEWGEGLEDYMGSARLTYAAEMTLNFRALSEDELQDHYGDRHLGKKRQIIAALEMQAVAPVALKITKARGASKGEIIFEYRFHEYRFVEQPHRSTEERQRRQAQRDAEVGQAAQLRVKEIIVAALRVADRDSGMSMKQLTAEIKSVVKNAKIRGYNLQTCLDELVRERVLDRFSGHNSNGTGKLHQRWKISDAPVETVRQPTRQHVNRKAIKNRIRHSVNGSVEA